MNIDNIEGLKIDDIISLYDEIIESPDLIAPHWCCYDDSNGNLLMDWDYNRNWSPQAPVYAVSGQRTLSQVSDWYVIGRSSAYSFYATGGHYSDGWEYTRYLCDDTCHRTCAWQGNAC